MNHEWVSYDLHPGDARALSAVVTDVVAPALRVATASQAIHRWHYLHYTDDLGPHVRFRVACSSAALNQVFPELDSTVRHSLAGVCTRWRAEVRDARGHSRCQASVYEPESAQYGGPPGLDVAERIFQRSSEFALEALQDPRSDIGFRRTLALLVLHHWAMQIAGPAGYHAFLESYAEHWASLLGDAVTQVHRMARRNSGTATRILQRAGSTPAELAVCTFVKDAHQLLQHARGLPVDFRQTAFSHMHLTSNRLGASLADELHHALLLLGMDPSRGGE